MPRLSIHPTALLSTLLALAVLSTACSSTRPTGNPNIIVFLVDDMGPMDTSVPFLTDADGRAKRYPLNDYYRTPAMQRLWIVEVPMSS